MSTPARSEISQLPPAERQLILLGHCFLNSSPFHTEASGAPNPVTEDHIFNELAKKKFRRVFKPFFRSAENRTPVCSHCHHRIDQGEVGKVVTFRRFGLKGLVEWNACYYPQPSDEEDLRTMEFQFRLLFRRFTEEAKQVLDRGLFLPSRRNDLATAIELASLHTAQWDAGKFAQRKRGYPGLKLDN